jgi:hypothetical protein
MFIEVIEFPQKNLPETATVLRCSKAHVQNLLAGKAKDTPLLPFIPLGRRKLIRRESLLRSLGARKHGGIRVWVAQWWENGARRSRVLGRCAQMSRSRAETLLAATLRPIDEGTAPVARPVLTFGEFVEGVYFPHCRRTWKQSTEMTTVPTIMKRVVGAFGDRILGTISRNDMRDLLETKAGGLSGATRPERLQAGPRQASVDRGGGQSVSRRARFA